QKYRSSLMGVGRLTRSGQGPLPIGLIQRQDKWIPVHYGAPVLGVIKPSNSINWVGWVQISWAIACNMG
ncbi:MAG: hypothetical protein ACKOBL_07215, partial [Chloroflexota bacterium]